MKTRDKIIFFVSALALIFWIIYLVREAIAPFIFALIIAYFLDPCVDFFQRKGKMSRGLATSLIMTLFLSILIALGALLIPIIYTQSIALIGALPQYYKVFTTEFYPKVVISLNHAGFGLDNDFSHLVADERVSAKLLDFWQGLLNNAISSSKILINIISLIFIAPILIFYLLKDWDALVGKINNYLPKKSSSAIRAVARDIDKTLSGYVRGQFNVCFILAAIYSILLSVAGLNFGFLIGFLTGLFSFLPFIGMLCGVFAAAIVGLFQWGFDLPHALVITAVFVFGQIVESNFLTPRLVGAKIGLHPVWVIFGLFFFGSLFGLTGILFAVPTTAISGVIIKHFAFGYKKKFT